MALRITFDLEDKDLKYFRSQMRKAQAAAKQTSEDEVIKAASDMVATVRKAKPPGFVVERLTVIEQLAQMLQDEEWQLEGKERKNVVSALTYFADPEDLIPDEIPVLGFIDDAIMIELVAVELKHELDAFTDFCAYRQSETSRNRSNLSREDWLESRRKQLHARMRRRRGGGAVRATRTRIRLF